MFADGGSVAEKRRIVELTLVPGASVALVARAHGVNANQVFKWRRDFERGELSEPVSASASLLPVVLSGGDKPHLHLWMHSHRASGPCADQHREWR